MKKTENEITIYYNSNSVEEKKAMAYARSSKLKAQEVDVTKTLLSETLLKELAERLGVEVKNLANEESPSYKEKVEGKEFEDKDYVTLFRQNPDLLKTPIAAQGDNAIFVKTPTDILDLHEVPKSEARHTGEKSKS